MIIEIFFTKTLPKELLDSFSGELFSINMRDFIAIKYIYLPRKPVLNDVLIFTSRNAVKGFCYSFSAEALQGKKIFVVGDQTAFLIEKLGVKVAIQKDYARDFSLLKNDELPQGPYDWFCGTRSLHHIVDSLRGHYLNRYEVYHTSLCPYALAGFYQAIVFFSPSAVTSFLEKNSISQNTRYFAIGKTTSEALLSAGASEVLSPEKPSVTSLIQLIKKYFHARK